MAHRTGTIPGPAKAYCLFEPRFHSLGDLFGMSQHAKDRVTLRTNSGLRIHGWACKLIAYRQRLHPRLRNRLLTFRTIPSHSTPPHWFDNRALTQHSGSMKAAQRQRR